MKINLMSHNLKNALTCIKQIKEGEWIPCYNDLDRSYLTAYHKSVEDLQWYDPRKGELCLWLANGPFFCDINDKNTFGYVWRHLVYWFAARPLKKKADKAMKEKRKKERTKLWDL